MNNSEKQFTSKQVYILVFVVVVAIAFFETSYAVWRWEFWRGFLLNVLIYGAVGEFIAVLFASNSKN